jgi:hypothetical protein
MKNRLRDNIEKEEKVEEEVHPTEAAPPQEVTVTPATVSALATLLDSLTSHNTTIKDLAKSLWSNVVWIVMFVAIIVIVEMLSATTTTTTAEDVLKRFLSRVQQQQQQQQCTASTLSDVVYKQSPR